MADIKKRIWELDFLKGIAIIIMVVFHIAVDLNDFYNFNINISSGFMHYSGIFAVSIFITVAGISSVLSKNNIKRGVPILLFSFCLTIATYFFSREIFIRFGILHFLGISIILSHFLKRLNNVFIFAFAITAIIIGNYFKSMYVSTPYLFPFGLIQSNFTSMDYYPLFPWLGVFMLGILLGKTAYSQKKSVLPFQLSGLIYDFISYLGRHSLIIYLLHQPIILSILWVINETRGRFFCFVKLC